MEEHKEVTPVAYVLPKGFSGAEEFIKLWNDCYMIGAKTNAWPMLIFTNGEGIPAGLYGKSVSVCNGYWKPHDGGEQSCLLSFIQHEGVSLGGSFELVTTRDPGVTLFNVMTQENGKGNILVVLPVGTTELTDTEREIVDVLIEALKAYVETVPVEQPTIN